MCKNATLRHANSVKPPNTDEAASEVPQLSLFGWYDALNELFCFMRHKSNSVIDSSFADK